MPLTRKKILDTVKRAQLYHDENDKMRKDLPSWLAAFAELMYNQGIEDATKIFVGNPNYAKKPVKKDQ